MVLHPDISVIVPVYNPGDFLGPCVESILAQEFHNFELILVDDGSTDGSSHVCDEYATRDRRVKVIHQMNSGCPASRAKGLSAASGRYVCFIDSDDWVEADHLGNFISVAEREKADMVVLPYYLNDAPSDENALSRLKGKDVIKAMLSGHLHAGLVFRFCKREVFERYGIVFPRYDYFEDMYVSCALHNVIDHVAECPAQTYHYRPNPTSLTLDTNTKKRIKCFHEFVYNMTSIFDKYGFWEDSDLVNALYAEVISQKKRLMSLSPGEEIDPVLSSAFKDAYLYYHPHAVPDWFLYLGLRYNKSWPMRLFKKIKEFVK